MTMRYADQKDLSLGCWTHNASIVLDFEKGALWGGGGTKIRDAIEAGIVSPVLGIDLAGTGANFAPAWPITANDAARTTLPPVLVEKPATTPVINIRWPDHGVPVGLTMPWWKTLAEYIRDQEGDVIMGCVGGHGRTGTALCLIAGLLDMIPDAQCPIAWVREVYCDQAVETDCQRDYIETILGIVCTTEVNELTGWNTYHGKPPANTQGVNTYLNGKTGPTGAGKPGMQNGALSGPPNTPASIAAHVESRALADERDALNQHQLDVGIDVALHAYDTGQSTLEEVIGDLQSLGLDESTIEKILGGNHRYKQDLTDRIDEIFVQWEDGQLSLTETWKALKELNLDAAAIGALFRASDKFKARQQKGSIVDEHHGGEGDWDDDDPNAPATWPA